MDILLLLLIFGSIGGLGAYACTRSAKLSRLAQDYGCQFDRRKNSVTTQLSAGRLELFTQFFHQYLNVFTLTDHMAFIRLADDLIFQDDNPKTKPLMVSLFTAEMRKTQFPTLKIAPLKSPFAKSQYTLMKTNIAAIDEVYRIHAPNPSAGMLFTPYIIGLLKTNPNVYLELNDNALIYHEHTLISPDKLEDFRFRAMQILSEFETIMSQLEQKQPAAPTTTPPSQTPSNAEQRAQAMLQSFATTRRSVSATPTNSWRWIWFFVVGALFLAITFLSWFALHNWVGR